MCQSQSHGLEVIHLVTLLLDQHLLNTYCMSGTLMGRDTAQLNETWNPLTVWRKEWTV